MKPKTLNFNVGHNDKTITLPNGVIVDAQNLTGILRQYYKLSPEDQSKEKSAWIEVLNTIMPPNHKGDVITDIILLPDGKDTHKVVFAYGNAQYK